MRSSLLTAALLLPLLVSAQTMPAHPPDMTDLMNRVVQRAKYEKEAKLYQQFRWRQERTVKKYDSDGKLEDDTTLVFEIIPTGGQTAQVQMLEKNGRPLVGDEQQKETEKELKFRESVQKMRNDSEQVDLNQELLGRYSFTYRGEEAVNGRAAHVLDFEPKPGDLPEHTRMDRIFNHLRGRVWVDEGTYALSRVDMTLTEPVTFYLLLGAVKSLHFIADMEVVGGRAVVPRDVHVIYVARKLFTTEKVDQHSQYSDYQAVATTAAQR
jgi:hypothetical protein